MAPLGRLGMPALLAIAIAGCSRRPAPSTDGRTDAASVTPHDASIEASTTAGIDAGSTAPLVRMFEAHPAIATLDDVPRRLPRALLESFVLKHGRDRRGERGHLVERRISQSADPDAPRAILFDPASGLVVSYNGGLATQSNGQRLDIAAFDDRTKTFGMWAVDFPIDVDAGRHGELRTGDCASCHGPRLRPIFSMYPDWPGFYGSDNDELTNARVETQAAELADYRRFRRDVAPKHPRYAPLFAQTKDETFPYRPNTDEDIHAVSRAFAFRPGLRLGLLLNRLAARMVADHVIHHPRFDRLGAPFLASLLRCPIDLVPLKSEIDAAIGGPLRVVSGALHYRDAWKIFGLEVRDIDIRYGYGHEGYRSDDASANPMAVGYIGTYWNSYFDGSATIDELVAYALLVEEAKRYPDLGGLATPNGLRRKYEHLAERYRLDEAFFRAMDAHGLWIPIPYPKQLNDVHHREGFGKDFEAQHERLCRALGAHIKGPR